MPTVQFTDDFNHAIDSGYYTAGFFATGSSPAQVNTPLYQSQAFSLKLPRVATTDDVGLRRDISSPGRWGWQGFSFRLPALPGSNDRNIARFDTGSGSAEGYLVVNPAGTLYAYIDSGSSQPYGTITANTWYWVEEIFDANDGAGNNLMYWRVNGVDQTTVTAVKTAQTAARLGFHSTNSQGTGDVFIGLWKGGIPTDATDWLGEPTAGQLLAPSADSVDGAWTDQSGGTSLFAAIDETTASDTDYIRSPLSPSSSACRVKLTAGADPSSSTGHKINWRVGKDATGGQTIGVTVTLRQGGGDSLGAGTQIATFTRSNVDALTTYTETLSGGEADAITNYGDLYLEFSGNAT